MEEIENNNKTISWTKLWRILWWSVFTISLPRLRINLKTHFGMCPWGHYHRGLTAREDPLLKIGSIMQGLGPKWITKGERRKWAGYRQSFPRFWTVNAPLDCPTASSTQLISWPIMMIYVFKLWASRNPSFLTALLSSNLPLKWGK